MGCEGLELHILHRPHMDSIDLDLLPILGMGYWASTVETIGQFRVFIE